MEHEMVVLEGKVFTVDLQSMLGATSYGWCLSGLPKGIILEGTQTIPTAPGIAPVIQRFYFGVSSAEETTAELTFVLACSFQPAETAKEHTVSLTIIPGNSDKYVAYNETLRQKEADNAANTAIPYGVLPPWDAVQDAIMKYGFPCSVQNSGMAYAFPAAGCQDSLMKYGYPCATQTTMRNEPFFYSKYGYPCR